jgi:ubiquinol-cytochrome c reductase cytochrome b subunit
MRLLNNFSLSCILTHAVYYPTPISLTYFWSFGFLSFCFLAIQIVTGFFLSMHYIPNISHAFLSIERIMRDVNYGWLFRYVHANGASFFFFILYIHIARGLYYKSFAFPRYFVWASGVILYFLTMGSAFIGYVLPWGQMSFWGATVITNLVTAIPYIGNSLAFWIWGGFSVGNATLNRFYSIHYLLPFILLALSFVHIFFLHSEGSSNPLGLTYVETINFYPYFYLKDFVSLLFIFHFFIYFSFFEPDMLGHSDNYIPANSMSTPHKIVPEWYFLPFYAILRTIPNKILGVIAMLCSICLLFLMPIFDYSYLKSSDFRPVFKFFLWFFFVDTCLLGWLGAQIIEEPFIILSIIGTIYYFSFFLIILPVISYFEQSLYC